MEYRERAQPNRMTIEEPGKPSRGPSRNIWIYVATIGELNLAEQFIRDLIAVIPDSRLILLTDRHLYVDTYRRKFPDAVIAITDGHAKHAEELLRRFRPETLIVAEIPCWPADAPCRLRYPLLALVASSGAPIMLVNAWIYDYPPASRAERLERMLSRREYLRTMRLITAQTDEIRDRLISEGADRRRVHVTGNMKFDILAKPACSLASEVQSPLLAGLASSQRPCIVAGSVGKIEQTPLIAAFRQLRETHAARIVVALRHPENDDHTRNLVELLDKMGLTSVQRTTHGDVPLAEDCDCLILDTFGELARFYSVGALAYVARDHNVLEPMACGIPVSVLSGWKSAFPSYPVYRVLRERGLLLEANDADDLIRIWTDCLDNVPRRVTNDDSDTLEVGILAGATARNLELVLNELKAVGTSTTEPDNRSGAQVQLGA